MSLFWGFEIHKSARIGYSFILSEKLVMLANSSIGNFNLCKSIDLLHLGNCATIGSLNIITGFSSRYDFFSHVDNRRCELIMSEHSAITIRHIIDCNGGIYIGRYSTLAGYRSQILTHSIDVYNNRQHADSISIGDYCFVGTSCVLLPGSCLPSYSVLAAGSVLNKKHIDNYCIYAGVPSVMVKKIQDSDISYFRRSRGYVS